MTRRRQYRFLAASTLAIFWIVAGVYAALGAEDQPAARSILLRVLTLPYTLGTIFGAPMRVALGTAGSVLALVVLWIVVTMALWAVFELIARVQRG